MKLRVWLVVLPLKLLGVLSVVFGLCILGIYADSYGQQDFIADVGIVYGNKVEVNGEPSRRLEARLKAAIDLYQLKKISRILVSGGVGVEGYDEAIVMKAYLISQGIPAMDILVDSRGFNTHLTSLNAIAALGRDVSVVAISQRYHISRAKLSLKHAGFEAVYGFAPQFMELRDVYSYAREVLAWFKYRLKGL